MIIILTTTLTYFLFVRRGLPSRIACPCIATKTIFELLPLYSYLLFNATILIIITDRARHQMSDYGLWPNLTTTTSPEQPAVILHCSGAEELQFDVTVAQGNVSSRVMSAD